MGRLPVSNSLQHRGFFVPDGTPLYPPPGVFAAIGGRAGVAKLVDGLYDRFEADPHLKPAFRDDLSSERAHQKVFMETWLGGESAYFEAGWRPGLKNRHEAISISRGMAGRWVGHFLDSLAEVTSDPDVVRTLKPFVSQLAMGLVNRESEPTVGDGLRRRCSGKETDAFRREIGRDEAEGVARSAKLHPQTVQIHGPMLLLHAAVKGKARAVAELLRLGVDPNIPASLSGAESKTYGLPMLLMTPLCAAMAKNREATVQLLLDHGAKYDIFSAACLGDIEGISEALDDFPDLANANDPACDLAQVTPLRHAVFAGQFETARLLLDRGALVGPFSVRMVEVAANSGREDMVDLLLEHGATAATLGAGKWVLHEQIAAKLVAHGADVNHAPGAWIGMCCTGNSGHREDIGLVKALLGLGAAISAAYNGRTALHCASQAGYLETLKALVEFGAEVNAVDQFGMRPLDAVELAGKTVDREPIRQFLVGCGAVRS